MRSTMADRKNASTSNSAVTTEICSTFSLEPEPPSVATTDAVASTSTGTCQSAASTSNASVAAL